jgi:hypothetical protein
MNLLIAIKSCARDQAVHRTARETWLSHPLTPEHHFFMGAGCLADQGDETVLANAEDDYAHLSDKLREIIRFAVSWDRDFIFVCDADTYVCVPRLLSSGFQHHDYMGSVGDTSYYSTTTMCCTGAGFWLSRKAMEILKDAPVGPGKAQGAGFDDWWTFHTLLRAGIVAHNDDRYRANREIQGQAPAADNDYIILHDTGNECLRNPEKMLRAHEIAKTLCAS